LSRDDGGAEVRRVFAVPKASGDFDGIELGFLDPADEDERALLIRAEHPELALAIERGDEEIEIDGQAMNPHLHLTIHEIVATQLWQDDPPEVWQTGRRLLDAGYERHEILHMLGSAVATTLWAVLEESRPYASEAYVRALHLLPASWEQQRHADR
jgi:Domain of unknown function (DUF1841)